MTSMISFTEKVRFIILLTFKREKAPTNDLHIGLGFIMLLSGDPGVGKTLTAESGTPFQLPLTVFH